MGTIGSVVRIFAVSAIASAILPNMALAQSSISSINTIYDANTNQYLATDSVNANAPAAGPLVAAPPHFMRNTFRRRVG